MINEFKSKYPKRRGKVVWPSDKEILEQLKNGKKLDNLEDPVTLLSSSTPPTLIQDRTAERFTKQKEADNLIMKLSSLLSDRSARKFIVQEDIKAAVKTMKKSVGEGPQQITPWMIKQAVECSENGSCPLVIAQL